MSILDLLEFNLLSCHVFDMTITADDMLLIGQYPSIMLYISAIMSVMGREITVKGQSFKDFSRTSHRESVKG